MVPGKAKELPVVKEEDQKFQKKDQYKEVEKKVETGHDETCDVPWK